MEVAVRERTNAYQDGDDKMEITGVRVERLRC